MEDIHPLLLAGRQATSCGRLVLHGVTHHSSKCCINHHWVLHTHIQVPRSSTSRWAYMPSATVTAVPPSGAQQITLPCKIRGGESSRGWVCLYTGRRGSERERVLPSSILARATDTSCSQGMQNAHTPTLRVPSAESHCAAGTTLAAQRISRTCACWKQQGRTYLPR